MRVLFIACYSPLINNSASIETLQYLNNIAQKGMNEVHLLTVDFPENSIYYDGKLGELMDDSIIVHKISGGKLFNKLVPKKKTGSFESKNTNSTPLRKALRKIKNSLVIPDMYYQWAKTASDYGNNLIKEMKFDAIFAMHEPPSSVVCGTLIKKKNKDIPFITYWSDPWLKDSTREKAFFIKKLIERKMEGEVIKNSDKYIFVTIPNRDEYIKDYNVNKENTFVLTRGYDGQLYSKIKKFDKPEFINEDKINVIYAGEIFSKLRDIRPFTEALTDLKNENFEMFNYFNILFFGNIDDIEGKEKLKSLGNVKISPRIPYEDVLNYTLKSEILLLFGNKNSNQIPAKVYDYMGCEGKILTIYGDYNDPLKKVVENNEKSINVYNNKNEIKDALIKCFALYKEGNLLNEPNKNYEQNKIADDLIKIIKGEV